MNNDKKQILSFLVFACVVLMLVLIVIFSSKNKESSVETFPETSQKTTKVMVCSLIDLDIQYEGINNVNCYIVIIDLQKESSKEKLEQLVQFIQNCCETTKKFFLLGVKKVDDDEEQNEIKVTKKEIEEKLDGLNLDYEYYELNADNSIEISDKIIEMFKFCFTNTLDENDDIKDENDSRSCFIY